MDHVALGEFRGEGSRDLGDDARRMCVSATATPSAASAGVGACFSLRSRATTAPTWPLGAPPAPATVFFTVAGAGCAVARPPRRAADTSTPPGRPPTAAGCPLFWEEPRSSATAG